MLPKHVRCLLRHTEMDDLVPAGGNDPPTCALSGRCSATELREIKGRTGSPTWLRTTVLLVNSQALCQLRYRGTEVAPRDRFERPTDRVEAGCSDPLS